MIQDNEGKTFLHLAAEHGHQSIIEVALLVNSESVALQDKRGFTVLHVAIASEHIGIIEILLNATVIDELTALKDEYGRTALHLAQERGLGDVAEKLVRANPLTLTMQDIIGWSPLHWALFSNKMAILEMFLETVPSVAVSPTKDGWTLLHIASMLRDERSGAINIILAAHPDILKIQDKHGHTALHLAAMYGYREIVEALCSWDNEIVGIRDKHGWTALHWAVCTNNTEGAEWLSLLMPDAMTFEDNDGRTAIQSAAWLGDTDMVALLRKCQSIHERIEAEEEEPLDRLVDSLHIFASATRPRSQNSAEELLHERLGSSSMPKVGLPVEQEMLSASLPHNQPQFANFELVYPNGNQYNGDVAMLNDAFLPHGYGTMHYRNGDIQSGTFMFGRCHGYGTYKNKDGDYYAGNYSKDLCHGQGEFFYASSQRRYVGGFSDGMENGPATIKITVNTTCSRNYIGWVTKNGRLLGEGTVWYTKDDKRIKQADGFWFHDKLHGFGSLRQGGGEDGGENYDALEVAFGMFVGGRMNGPGTLRGITSVETKVIFRNGDAYLRYGERSQRLGNYSLKEASVGLVGT